MPVGGTAFFGQNQHPRITTTYLNQLNRHGDPAPGVNVSTAQVSGSIVQPYDGFQGGKLTITNPWAVQFADPAVGPLYGGIYQYVRLDPEDTAPLQRGQVVFWSDELNYMITAEGVDPVAGPYKLAGVALNGTLPGYWDFIQITGIALVKFSGAGTIGQSAAVNPAVTPATVTAITAAAGPNNFGTVVLTAAVANAVSPVEVNIPQGYNF